MRVVLLSGGGGGARFARGLAAVLDPGELTVIGNVGDDVEVLGLYVSPDLDSLLYTLAGLIDTERGWGRADETWNALDSAADWGGENWFRLGDRDLGIHLVRTQLLRSGVPLSTITAGFTDLIGLATRIAPATDDRLRTHVVTPATDDRLRTHVVTPAGRFGFQEWFVGRRHADEVDAVEYDGASDARPGAGVLEALAAADAIVFAPSNPYLSIGPILAIEAVGEAIGARTVRCVAVSPLVGGAAVTGPLGRMLTRMAGGTTPAHVTQCHKGMTDALVVDGSDVPAEADVELVVAQTLMVDHDAERRLAEVVLETACG